MNDQIDTEDYVLVPKRKAKLSRARKSVIGFMVLGAVAAIGGGGTFASFSASTTNDSSFSTARLAMRNGGTGGCITPSARVAGIADPDVDTNDVGSTSAAGAGANDCPSLFTTPIKPGETKTATVTIENTGDAAGDLSVFTAAACSSAAANTSFNRGDETNLCDRIDISIENDETDDCIFPVADAANCDALGQATANASFATFGTALNFAGKQVAYASLPAGGEKTFTVTVRMKITDCNAANDNVGDATFGFADNTGTGCDNGYMNQKALLNLRWQMQA